MVAERDAAGAAQGENPPTAPLRQRLMTVLLMAVPFAVALFLLALALASGKAQSLAIGWLALQVAGYGLFVSRLGLYPLRPALAAYIAIHWLGAAFVLYFLMGGGV